MDQRTKARILSRRRKFLAIALTGVATSGLGACSESRVCLSMAPPADAGDEDGSEGGDADNPDGHFIDEASTD